MALEEKERARIKMEEKMRKMFELRNKFIG